MNSEFDPLESLESALQRCQPAAPNERYLGRLANLPAIAARDEITGPLPDAAFERFIADVVKPTSPDENFLSHLTSRNPRATTPVAAPIPFVKPLAPPAEMLPRIARRRGFALAAAVAICGAITALFMPPNGTHSSDLASSPSPRPQLAAPGFAASTSPAAPNPGFELVSNSFDRGITEAVDQGVVWRSTTEPQRVVRVTYLDRYTLESPDGRKVEVEQPRVEYLIVPEKVD